MPHHSGRTYPHKGTYFVLEALNSLATTYYFYYVFFFMQKRFGFGDLGNLTLAAVNGFIYLLAAWAGGRYGQRAGYYRALAVGFSTMAAGLAVGAFINSVAGQFMIMVICTLGMCFTWPNLEALVSEQVSARRLRRMIGIYNTVWAAVGGLAYFAGGGMLEKLGMRSLFWFPIGIHLMQLAILAWLARRRNPAALAVASEEPASVDDPPPVDKARARAFLRMAWIANPFAYVSINTIVAVIPSLAQKLHLTPTFAGIFCSIWFFARLLTFVTLWLWPGWHYRSNLFFGAYGLLILSFGAILLIPNLATVILAQVVYGAAAGLIYYSSLFYSMDVGDTKGEHGGVHEAAIGGGIFLGPAVGAASLYFFPGIPNAGAWAVSLLLLGGMFALGYVYTIAKRQRRAAAVTADAAPLA